MDVDDREPSPDALRLVVDGVAFDVVHDASQPGAYHYRRLTPPAVGYGFTSRRSDHQRSTTAAHLTAIRHFLMSCDPVTGYIEDEPDDGSSDGDS